MSEICRLPGDLRLISPTWPWLPPAATGQLAPGSSFSHLVTLREEADPYSLLPPAARGRAGRFTDPSDSRAPGGEGAPRQFEAQNDFCSIEVASGLCYGSRQRHRGAAWKLKLCRGGRRYGQGSWARNNRPWIHTEDPDARLTSFAPALTSPRAPPGPAGCAGRRYRDRHADTAIGRQRRTQTRARSDQRVTGPGTNASLHPRDCPSFSFSPSFAPQKVF